MTSFLVMVHGHYLVLALWMYFCIKRVQTSELKIQRAEEIYITKETQDFYIKKQTILILF